MDFSDLSERSKRRKTEDLRSNYNAEELSYAAPCNCEKKGNLFIKCNEKYNIFNSFTCWKISKALKKIDQKIIPYTAEEALSIVVEGKLT